MPRINHLPAGELGKIPIEQINFSLSNSQLRGLDLFIILVKQIEKRGLRPTLKKTSQTFHYSAKKAHFKR